MSSLAVERDELLSLDRVERHQMVLAAVVAVGIVLRAWGLGAESFWFDEIFGLGYVRAWGTYAVVRILPTIDPHPPLYYGVLSVWTSAFGYAEVGVRSLSTVADVGSICLIYLVAARLYDRRVGLLSATLFALSPFYVWYGREARMYALATFLTLTSFYLFLRMGDGDRRRRTASGYVLATLALCYTHAFGPLIVLSQNVILGGAVAVKWRADGRVPQRVAGLPVRRWIGLQAVVTVASVPYYRILLRGMFGTGQFEPNVAWVPSVTPVSVWKIFGTYLGRTVPPVEPWGYERLWAYGSSSELAVVGEVVTLAGLAVASFAVVESVRADDDREGFSPEPVLVAWLLTTIAVLYGLSVLVTPVLYDRFTAMAGVAFLILLARGLSLLADSRRELTVVAAATILVLAVPLAGLHAEKQKPQTREAVSVLDENTATGDLVVVSPTWDRTFKYYLEDWASSTTFSNELDIRHVEAGASRVTLERSVTGHDVVWMLVSYQTADERDRMVNGMRELEYEVERHEDLTKYDVYRFVAS